MTSRRIEEGWLMSKTPGVLVKGEGAAKVEMRVTEVMPSKAGASDYNPVLDAFAAKLGADIEGPNRYRFGDLLLDANGACRDERECPECGSAALRYGQQGQVIGGGEYRFTVPDGQGDWTYCRTCVSEQEIGDIRQQKAAAQARTGGRR